MMESCHAHYNPVGICLFFLQLYQQVKQRLRFFERYHRTVKALENGMEIRNNKPKRESRHSALVTDGLFCSVAPNWIRP